MPDTTLPAPAPQPRWQPALERLLHAGAKRLVQWAIPILMAAAGSVATYFGFPRTTTVEVPSPERLVDATPIDYEGARYDGGTEDSDHRHVHPLAAPEPARWPVDRITYGIDYDSATRLNPPLPADAIKAAFRQAVGWWGEQLQVDFVEVAHGASPMVPIRFERIDGPQGVLAEAYLADGTTRPKPMRFDSSERWTAGGPAGGLVSLPTVACHELGHTLGLGHDAANAPAVMRPSYTASIPREQERDILRMVQLGYVRRAKMPPGAVDVLSFPVQVKTDDVIQSLRNAGYTVTK